MEELRSAEVLDKEIRADSTKKAEKILLKADTTVKSLLNGVDVRIEKAKIDAQREFSDQLLLFEKNAVASLPLERQRKLVAFIHDSLVDAMNIYFEKIGEKKRFSIIERLVEHCKESLAGKKIDAKVIGFDVKSAKKLLEKLFGAGNISSCIKADAIVFSDETVEGFLIREGIILCACDGSVSCRLTLDEKVKEILDEKSYALATTLFCGRLPE